MMFSALKDIDRVTAAGILARAALSLENESNPAANPLIPNEKRLREQLYDEACKKFDLAFNLVDSKIRESIGDLLDLELDKLLTQSKEGGDLDRLGSEGKLPSDQYRVEVIPNVIDFYGRKFANELPLIESTVHSADREQHICPSEDSDAPAMISLYAKTFLDKYPLRNFILLVIGDRTGRSFFAHQVWRLYSDEVELGGAKSPLEMLEQFANRFGTELVIGKQRGKLIYSADLPTESLPNHIEVKGKSGKPFTFTVSYFRQAKPAPGHQKAALAVGINLDEYRAALKKHGW